MRTHYTGEVVGPTQSQEEEDKVLDSFLSRGSTLKVLLSSLKFFWPIYAMILFMVFFTLFLFLFLLGVGFIEAILPIAFMSLIIVVVPITMSISFLPLKEDRVEVTKDSVSIFFHYMVNMLMIYNSIEISDIKEVRVAGKGYLRERKERTAIYDRLWSNPKAPPGGLYFMFHDPKALVVIEMVRPVPIVNLSTLIEKKMGWGPSLKRVYVKEVIVEVDRKYHNEFISLMEKMIAKNKVIDNRERSS
ncbi:MAG: hypothetical protein MUC62_09395 [Candidatus Thermoplasmatota archaeon]|jgi:hypothetical protein|nr:hypothetical protein [Candidatus Thermoplasmatota archaeon]